MAKPTAGPWIARPARTGDEWWVEAPRPDGSLGYLAECVGRQEANKANARLIAAAPTMFDVLRRIAYEPFGAADATHEQVLDAITALAREVIGGVNASR